MPEWIFYDGNCGLCHRMVRFVLFVDRAGALFRFAPLGGETFRSRISEHKRAALPDSIVVEAAGGRLLARSSAVLHILRRLGGIWRAGAAVAGIIPRAWLDRLYDWVARVRHGWFQRPADVCPVLPPALRSRFGP